MLRTLYLACRTVLPAGLLLIAIAALGVGGAAAQQGTPRRARPAPRTDAALLRLHPDVAKVTHCMMAKRGQLSAACRMAMAGGSRQGLSGGRLPGERDRRQGATTAAAAVMDVAAANLQAASNGPRWGCRLGGDSS